VSCACTKPGENFVLSPHCDSRIRSPGSVPRFSQLSKETCDLASGEPLPVGEVRVPSYGCGPGWTAALPRLCSEEPGQTRPSSRAISAPYAHHGGGVAMWLLYMFNS
jgi:hypothetical protein